VEGSAKCKFEYLEVSKGETRDSANQVAKLCGTELPKPLLLAAVISSSGFVQIPQWRSKVSS